MNTHMFVVKADMSQELAQEVAFQRFVGSQLIPHEVSTGWVFPVKVSGITLLHPLLFW